MKSSISVGHASGGCSSRCSARRGRTVPLDEVVEHTWDDGDRPSNPERAIRTYVFRLRTAFGPDAEVVETALRGHLSAVVGVVSAWRAP